VFLSDVHGVPIRLDDEALDAAGVDPAHQTVTGTCRGEALGDCLASLLPTNSLTFRVEPAGLAVTTIQAAEAVRQGVSALKRALPSLRLLVAMGMAAQPHNLPARRLASLAADCARDHF
jgi:hypothetical protein